MDAGTSVQHELLVPVLLRLQGGTGSLIERATTMPLPRDRSYLNRQFAVEMVVIGVRWYVGCRIGYRDLVGMLRACRTGMDAAAFHEPCGEVRALEASR